MNNNSLIPRNDSFLSSRFDFESPFQMLKEFFSTSPLQTWTPKVDMKETKKDITLTAELAGFDKKNIQVNLNDDHILTISGHRKKDEKKEDNEYSYHERYYGSFERAFDFSNKNLDKNKPNAKFENGILTVTLEKNPELQAKNHKIEIQ